MPEPRADSYLMFATPLGVCGLAWGIAGLTRLLLPHADPGRTAAALERSGARRCSGAPPAAIAESVAQLERYFAGEPVDLSALALDLGRVGAHDRDIYIATRAIGWGETVSYGELARRTGVEGGARAIGQAMARNPWPVIVPCHRVLAAGGRLGGFSAPGGTLTKERLLELEGASPGPDLPLLRLMETGRG